MVTTLISAAKIVGSFFTRFITDYISNIVVTAIIFPEQVIKHTAQAFNSLVKPITISF